jgi:hypothetical protein
MAGVNTSPYGVSLMVTSPTGSGHSLALTRFSGTLIAAADGSQGGSTGHHGQCCNVSFHDCFLPK